MFLKPANIFQNKFNSSADVRTNLKNESSVRKMSRKGTQTFHGVGSINGSDFSQIVGYGQIGMIVGSNISLSYQNSTLPEAEIIEIVAKDAAGKILESFKLRDNCKIELHITAPEIRSIKTSVGEVIVREATHIDSIKIASGDISVEHCGDIATLSSMSGDVTIEKCYTVGKASSMSGDVRVTKRDASPKRK